VARIVRDGESVVLTTAEPREYSARDAEALTEEVLGFRLPLSGLADWIRGRPSDEAAAKVERDEQGRLRALEERGWKIEYQEYEGKLPSRMRLTYPDIELRLAISRWE
jgi:outer membrane lipoprotein LolB